MTDKPMGYYSKKLVLLERIAAALEAGNKRRHARLGTEKVEEKLAEEYGF